MHFSIVRYCLSMTGKNIANGSFEEAFLTAIVQYELGPLYAGISSLSWPTGLTKTLAKLQR